MRRLVVLWLALAALILALVGPSSAGTLPQADGDVVLRDLLAVVGAQGGTLHAVAINDYAVELPAADAQDYDVLVAYRMNGAAMSVRDKGPLWVIYPISQHPELEGPDTDAKMIWQLRELTVQ